MCVHLDDADGVTGIRLGEARIALLVVSCVVQIQASQASLNQLASDVRHASKPAAPKRQPIGHSQNSQPLTQLPITHTAPNHSMVPRSCMLCLQPLPNVGLPTRAHANAHVHAQAHTHRYTHSKRCRLCSSPRACKAHMCALHRI